MKRCITCGQLRPLDEFCKNLDRVDGKNPYCRPCYSARQKRNRDSAPDTNRRYHLRYNYGLSQSQIDGMVEKQDYKCAICRDFISSYPVVDHDHQSGKIRGLLCRKCNVGIGMLRHSPGILTSAIKYLERNQKVISIPTEEVEARLKNRLKAIVR